MYPNNDMYGGFDDIDINITNTNTNANMNSNYNEVGGFQGTSMMGGSPIVEPMTEKVVHRNFVHEVPQE